MHLTHATDVKGCCHKASPCHSRQHEYIELRLPISGWVSSTVLHQQPSLVRGPGSLIESTCGRHGRRHLCRREQNRFVADMKPAPPRKITRHSHPAPAPPVKNISLPPVASTRRIFRVYSTPSLRAITLRYPALSTSPCCGFFA